MKRAAKKTKRDRRAAAPPPARLSDADRVAFVLAVERAAKIEAMMDAHRLRGAMLVADRERAHQVLGKLKAELGPRYRLTDGDSINPETGAIERAADLVGPIAPAAPAKKEG